VKRVVCGIRDNRVECFGSPIFVRASGEAMRAFVDECQKPESTIGQHPADYDLWLLDEFDDETGRFLGDVFHGLVLLRGVDAKEMNLG